ncbi:Inducible T-cell costimulator [Apodemus speciosus]|uniref:Inducible T-cell costimulator n=1 Tax=Apodemus speciosus TaxID=105296 RepID=A0ABQ0EDT9_APOSI
MGEINGSANDRMFSFHNGGVQISCKYPENVQQLKMRLFKEREVLCDLTKTKGSGNVVSIKNPMVCHYQLSNNSVSFFLNNPDSSQGSYYFCSLLIFDPPPFQEKNLSGEYLHIYESQICCQLKFWLPIGCAALVAVLLFGCTLIIWFAKKKYRSSVHDPNSEYMFMAAVNTAKKSRVAVRCDFISWNTGTHGGTTPTSSPKLEPRNSSIFWTTGHLT